MKKIITDYLFTPSAKTVQLHGLTSVDIRGLLLITNVTDNVVLYNFADHTKGGTVSGNIITLDYNTAAMSSGDNLQIFYDDADYTVELDSETTTINNAQIVELLSLIAVELKKVNIQLSELTGSEVKDFDAET